MHYSDGPTDDTLLCWTTEEPRVLIAYGEAITRWVRQLGWAGVGATASLGGFAITFLIGRQQEGLDTAGERSFSINILAWLSTTMLGLGVGSILFPTVRKRVHRKSRRESISHQRRLIASLADRMADELAGRYSLGSPIAYPERPTGQALLEDLELFDKQDPLTASVDPASGQAATVIDRLLAEADRADHRVYQLKNLFPAQIDDSGSAPYWLKEIAEHASRCELDHPFAFLASLQDARFDRLRELLGTSQMHDSLEALAFARDQILMRDDANAKWTATAAVSYVTQCEETLWRPPKHLSRWGDELRSVAHLAYNMADILHQVDCALGQDTRRDPDTFPIHGCVSGQL